VDEYDNILYHNNKPLRGHRGRGVMASGWESEGHGLKFWNLQATFASIPAPT